MKVAAPGESLITTYPGGRYAAVSGTSFSTGLVSGGTTLLVEARGKRPTNYHNALVALANATYVAGLGYGRIDLERAVNAAK